MKVKFVKEQSELRVSSQEETDWVEIDEKDIPRLERAMDDRGYIMVIYKDIYDILDDLKINKLKEDRYLVEVIDEEGMIFDHIYLNASSEDEAITIAKYGTSYKNHTYRAYVANGCFLDEWFKMTGNFKILDYFSELDISTMKPEWVVEIVQD